jgi:acyl-CoA reductase-like NAD-dependent aldehyde dehydrogenase
MPELPGFVDATVIAGVGQDDALVQSEIFGLAASVWTRDGARALRVGNALKFGTVWINDHSVLTPPEECTNIKHLVVNIEK